MKNSKNTYRLLSCIVLACFVSISAYGIINFTNTGVSGAKICFTNLLGNIYDHTMYFDTPQQCAHYCKGLAVNYGGDFDLASSSEISSYCLQHCTQDTNMLGPNTYPTLSPEGTCPGTYYKQ